MYFIIFPQKENFFDVKSFNNVLDFHSLKDLRTHINRGNRDEVVWKQGGPFVKNWKDH